MSITTMVHSYASGEIAPALYGRVDLDKWHAAASVARNMVVSYKGGMFSRGGTALVGPCLQACGPASTPPRNIEFTFNIFQSYILEFGDNYMCVVANGAYVTETPLAVTAATNSNPVRLTVPGNTYANGDRVAIGNIGGMTELNGQTCFVENVGVSGAGTFTLSDMFGNPINSVTFPAYTGGGTAARIYKLTTPYAAADLPYLKFVQSADVMSLCLVNQQTQQDYATQELTRLAANHWTIAPPSIQSSIGPPASCSAAASVAWSTGPGPAAYGYVVTAVDAATGEESVASPVGAVANSVDIAGQFGTITVTWAAVAGAGSYNIYRAIPDYTNTGTFTGQQFYFVGSSNTTKWQDTNITADFTITPPLHLNPFASSGNYPGVVAYFQQRRAYALTLNAPDTYEMSQTGAYTNFDSATPPIDSDAITGSPWASQVNGIQWMVPMPGGLVIFTGKDAWQLSGTAGAGSAISPSQQNAQPQESIGSSATLPPLKIGPNILYGQALGSAIRELNYNFYFNIYAGVDLTILSTHLLFGYSSREWAWSQEPYKVLWDVRNDGKLLSLTYLKDESIRGWTRHDTMGQFCSVATASEPPANAPYLITKRYVKGPQKWMYFQERMDNRLWQGNVEASWCVDCALALPQAAPQATLIPGAAVGSGDVVLSYIVSGGANYTAPAGEIIDLNGTGTGARVLGFTLGAGGVITGLTIAGGQNYQAPQIVITDVTGTGADIVLAADWSVIFQTDQPVFSSANSGSVIRGGGGIATGVQFVTSTEVIAQLPPATAITATIPGDPGNMPFPIPAGSWTLAKPVTTVSGLNHLEGMALDGLVDGGVVQGLVVTGGAVTLPNAGSQVLLGLPFKPQLQGMHADLPGAMIQGDRKRITGVTVRVKDSRGIKVGQDQPIAATQPNQAEVPWNVAPNLMTEHEDRRNAIGGGNAIPLFTGDIFVRVAGDFNTADGQPSPGMVAMQQDYPLPMEILAVIPKIHLGDKPNA
jgi:hypothetical protein